MPQLGIIIAPPILEKCQKINGHIIIAPPISGQGGCNNCGLYGNCLKIIIFFSKLINKIIDV